MVSLPSLTRPAHHRRRLVWIDQARGLAVLLMILDHVLAVAAPGHLLRFTVTRLSLPLFIACVVAVPHRTRSGLSLRLLCGMGLELVLNPIIGLAIPGPVFLLGMLGLAVGPWLASPIPAALGLIQALYLPLPDVWTGYQPGLVLVWAFIGLYAADELEQWAPRFPGWLATIGRRPLAWYTAHLVLLAAWVLA